jgi:hypothetical protein
MLWGNIGRESVHHIVGKRLLLCPIDDTECCFNEIPSRAKSKNASMQASNRLVYCLAIIAST